jgi:NAD(P)-dependent dehydrogenase (short-subunit alcohol dehydrogenase family)
VTTATLNFKMATGIPNASDLVKNYADNIAGKVILTTGVSQGSLGGQFVEVIATAKPRMLILAGRNPEKTQATADKLKQLYPDVPLRTLQLELGSLGDVRSAAEIVNSWDDVKNIDVVVCNAGIMAMPYGLTVDGYEQQFATNHLGHFLFTNLIMGKILASKAPRVVSVASHGHTMHPIRWADVHFDVGLRTL